jgi:hypothetical protein
MTPEEAKQVGGSPMFAAMRQLSEDGTYKRLDAYFMAAHWWEVWDALLASLVRIGALERERDTLHAALMVFEATWSTGGYLDPQDFWDTCWPRLNGLVPREHQSFLWAVEQEMRDHAAVAAGELACDCVPGHLCSLHADGGDISDPERKCLLGDPNLGPFLIMAFFWAIVLVGSGIVTIIILALRR